MRLKDCFVCHPIMHSVGSEVREDAHFTFLKPWILETVTRGSRRRVGTTATEEFDWTPSNFLRRWGIEKAKWIFSNYLDDDFNLKELSEVTGERTTSTATLKPQLLLTLRISGQTNGSLNGLCYVTSLGWTKCHFSLLSLSCLFTRLLTPG